MPFRSWTALARVEDGSKRIKWVPLILAPEWAESHPDNSIPRPGPAILRDFFEKISQQANKIDYHPASPWLAWKISFNHALTMEYDCQSCGACCQSPWRGDGYVRLYDIDLDLVKATGLPIIEQVQGYGDPPEIISKLGTLIDAEGRRSCAAFAGTVGASCACTIYGQRPNACRRFEAGGSLCRESRRRYGLPV